MASSVVMHGDCLELMKDLADDSVDMVLCDLPYGTTACAWDSVIPFDRLWEQYRRVIKENGAILLFGSQPFTSALGASSLSWLKYSWFWRKTRATGHLNAKKMPMKDVEECLVFYQKQPTYNSQGLEVINLEVKNSASHVARGKTTGATSVVSGGITRESYVQEFTGYPRQILDFPSEGNTFHPTQKPVSLCEYLIETYSNPGETVLDNTMGSGSTGVACRNTGRRFIGMEKDQNYFRISQYRLATEAAAK